MWQEFKEFILRGNVIDLAVGIIIGAAFTGIVNSLVNDIITPPLGLVLNGVDFTDLFIALDGEEYASLAVAQAAGAPTLNYGLFINAIIEFLIVAVALFILIRGVNRLNRRQEVEEEIAENAEPSTDEKILVTLEKLNTTLENMNPPSQP